MVFGREFKSASLVQVTGTAAPQAVAVKPDPEIQTQTDTDKPIKVKEAEAEDASAAEKKSPAQQQASGAIDRTRTDFAQPGAELGKLGKSAAKNQKKRQRVQKMGMGVMQAIGELSAAQMALCKSMKPGKKRARANRDSGELLVKSAREMERLIRKVLIPLFSRVSLRALSAKKSRIDLAALDTELGRLVKTRKKVARLCKGRFYGKRAVSAEAAADVELEALFDEAMLAALGDILKQVGQKGFEADLNRALKGISGERRRYWKNLALKKTLERAGGKKK
jgi:hypothetical protein